ncbi:hypothetical protein BDQ12DRAFT_682076 [Crucibulum laeve]|uniref:Uncharacterized protein n=1 Tax=Crucibulum laeve TaxID=68775 RepID=A0A5C3M6X8_9AGAR|nr:hypothetical protein BDQ12DRAFT_682076 [Crucibulum laeve]
MADSALAISKLIFAGSAIVLLMYGIYFTLTVICLQYLLANGRRNWILVGYLTVSLLVTTMFMAASVKYTELILLESAVDPLGSAQLASRLDLLQQVTYSVKIWLADSLLIYRLWVVWVDSYTVILIPSVLFVGSLATGIAGVALFHHVDAQNAIVNLGVGFHSLSVALNVLVTALIAGRLLYHRRTISVLGGEHTRQYLSLLAVFAESGAIYSITGLVYIPLYALHSNLIFVFAPLLEAASGIAPALILLRIALGVAVTRKTQRQVSTLQFGNHTKERKSSEFTASGGASGTLSVGNTTSQPHTREYPVGKVQEELTGGAEE